MITTGKTGYVRFHGKGPNWYDYDYSEAELVEWYVKIKNSDVEEVYIYFNNDIGVNAPRNAQLLMKIFEEDGMKLRFKQLVLQKIFTESSKTCEV